MKKWLLLVVCYGWLACGWAGEARPIADDPVLEQRMTGLAEKLRCLVCQNESLAGSRAGLAEDLRREIRARMREGLSDDEVIEFLVNRYGDFVLYDPPVKGKTFLLWFGPFLLLLAAGGALLNVLRQRRQQPAPGVLSEADRARARALLSEEGEWK